MIGDALLARTILALDTPNLGQACEWVQQYRERVYAFKIGGALAIGYGLPIVRTLREAGAARVFLDLKFHDIHTRSLWQCVRRRSLGSGC